MRRARAADAEAQKSRLLAEGARSDAEKLVGFLIDDFYDELEPTGRLETMGKLRAHGRELLRLAAARARDAAHRDLPRDGHRARGGAQGARGDIAAANRSFDTAQKVFERLYAADPKNEDTLMGLALTLFSRFNLAFLIGNRGDSKDSLRAADMLRPLAHAPNGSHERGFSTRTR
jgi:tetratricopeptide (TPR) repeat protein